MSSLALCAVVVTVLALVAPASAAKSKGKKPLTPDAYGVVNVTADAATDHEIITSTAFPNYTNGAVDNYYSMSHSHIDNSPFAEGTSSPADTGPLGQTAAAGNFSQPQYADARWPGSGGSATFGNQGGPYAVANASNYNAAAESMEASGGAAGSSAAVIPVATPKGVTQKLHVLLAAWKATWLPKLDLTKSKLHVATTLPVTTPSVTVPVGIPGQSTTTSTTSTTSTSTTGSTSTSTTPSSSSSPATALDSTTKTLFDPTSGALVASGESSLGKLSLAGGAISIAGIDVSAQITNDGTPKDEISIDIGAASIGGVPVTIDQDGVHIQGQGQALPYQQADDTLNGVLKQAGVQLFTVVPEVTTATNQETLTASGVHVIFDQPVDQSGVPAQTVEHILGEVSVSSLATPAGPIPQLNLGGPSSSSSSSSKGSNLAGGTTGSSGTSVGGTSLGGGGTSYTSGGTSGSTGGGSQSVPTELTSALSKPTWLLLAFLLWQGLAVATGASLWNWRKGGAS